MPSLNAPMGEWRMRYQKWFYLARKGKEPPIALIRHGIRRVLRSGRGKGKVIFAGQDLCAVAEFFQKYRPPIRKHGEVLRVEDVRDVNRNASGELLAFLHERR